jgi:dTDP-4-dehydrorhamnose reductase
MPTTHILILGAQGQVGRAVAAQASRRRIACCSLGRAVCDITDRPAVARAVAGSGLVVNCAAYTSVDQAEAEVKTAYRINAVGAENVATVCAEAGIPLVHLSTDHVFDGASPLPAREDDPARPVNAYGRSKLAGEIALRERLQSHIVLRTSWVFSADGQNFVKTMLRLAQAAAGRRRSDRRPDRS